MQCWEHGCHWLVMEGAHSLCQGIQSHGHPKTRPSVLCAGGGAGGGAGDQPWPCRAHLVNFMSLQGGIPNIWAEMRWRTMIFALQVERAVELEINTGPAKPPTAQEEEVGGLAWGWGTGGGATSLPAPAFRLCGRRVQAPCAGAALGSPRHLAAPVLCWWGGQAWRLTALSRCVWPQAVRGRPAAVGQVAQGRSSVAPAAHRMPLLAPGV